MKKIITFLVLITLFYSCEETQNVIYDGEQTFIGFSDASSSLDVIIDDSNSVDVTISASTTSSVDRTINLSVSEESTATSDNFTVPTSVVIPANSYFGSFTVQAVDNTIETDVETIIIELDGDFTGTVLSESTHVVNVKQVCPVDEDYFVGTYLMEQLSGAAPFASIDPAFGTQLVDIVVGESTTNRIIDFLYSPQNFQTPYRFTIGLVCNSFTVSGERSGSSILGCDGETSIEQSSPDVLSSYDTTASDDVITITVSDFSSDAGCNVDPYEAELRFTKQ